MGLRFLSSYSNINSLLADVRGREIAAVLIEGEAAVGAEHMIVIGLGDDGLRGVGAEGGGMDAVLLALVDQPAAGIGSQVEPHADQFLVDTAAAALNPDVLMLDHVGQMLQNTVV